MSHRIPELVAPRGVQTIPGGVQTIPGGFVSTVPTKEFIRRMCAQFFQVVELAGPTFCRVLSGLILNQPQLKLRRRGRPFELWLALAAHLLERVGERQPNKLLRAARGMLEGKNVQAKSILELRRGYKKRFGESLDIMVICGLFYILSPLAAAVGPNPEDFKQRVERLTENRPEDAVLIIFLVCIWRLCWNFLVAAVGGMEALAGLPGPAYWERTDCVVEQVVQDFPASLLAGTGSV